MKSSNGSGNPAREVGNKVYKVRDQIYGAGSRSFSLSEDLESLDAFYNLAFYVVNNFPLPKSHHDYFSQKLNIDCNQTKQGIINQLIINRLNTSDAFNLELPLRGIEVIFTAGDFIVTPNEEANLEVLLGNLEESFKSKSF